MISFQENGTYLVDLLLSKGYEVHGAVIRRQLEDPDRELWQIIHKDQPGDYVIATGEVHSVREFREITFSRLGLDYHDHIRCG